MKYTCSNCGHKGDTKKEKDAPLQALNGLYARFKFSEKLVREYMKLFGDCYQPKEKRLVEDLVKIWEAEYFERGGRGYAIDRDGMARCIEAVCNNQPRLKDGHGYLLAVMKSKAAEREAREEREKHETARNRQRMPSELAPVGTVKVEISDEERASVKEQLKEFNRNFGKGARG